MLWGANAFHGLVNIITKSSTETQGTKISARVSNDDNFFTVRHGGRTADGTTYRAWVRRTRYDGLQSSFEGQDNFSSLTDWGIQSAGLQFDWETESGRRARLWGRAYESDVGYPVDFGAGFAEQQIESKAGGQLAFSLDDPRSGTTWRAAYVKDRQRLRVIDTFVDIDQLQLEYKRELPTGERSIFTYGAGYDLIHSVADYFGDDVGSIRQNNARLFVSNRWLWPTQRLTLDVGVQALRNEFTGLDVQPSIRTAWSPEGLGTFWAAVSRAVRTPSIEEELFDGRDMNNEVVVATEAGWRGPLGSKVNVDIAIYSNDYDDVRFEGFDPTTFERFIDNRGYGSSAGIELAVDAKLTERWTLRGAYAFHRGSHGPSDESGSIEGVDGQYPVHLANLRSYFDLTPHWEIDAGLYAAERFDNEGGQEHWRADLRLGWKPRDDLRLSFGVQGLNEPLRAEYFDDEVRRLFYVAATWSN